jgi:uncharacterized delta-60 repeat protein
MRRIFVLSIVACTALALVHCVGDPGPAGGLSPNDAAADQSATPRDASRPILPPADAEPPCPVIEAGTPGSLDTTFAHGHKPFPRVGIRFDTKTGALDQKGRVYVVGGALNCAALDSKFDFAVLRLTATGGIDTAFGSGGAACFDVASKTDDLPTSVAVDAQNRLLIAGGALAGTDDGLPGVIRVLEDGKLDGTFGNAGVSLFVPSTAVTPSPYTAYGITVAADGIIVSGGDLHPFAESTLGFVTRLTATGLVDMSFANKGTYENKQVYGFRAGHIRGAGGTILVPARVKSPPSAPGWGIAVLGPTGTESVAPAGNSIPGAGPTSSPQAIVLSKSWNDDETIEHYLVAGSVASATGGAAVIQVHGNGSQHSPYGQSANTLVLPTFGWDSAYNLGPLVRQCDGRAVVAASKGNPGRPVLARFEETFGKLDTSYGTAGELLLDVDAGGLGIGYGAILLDPTTNRIIVVAGSSANDGPWVHRVNP